MNNYKNLFTLQLQAEHQNKAYKDSRKHFIKQDYIQVFFFFQIDFVYNKQGTE